MNTLYININLLKSHLLIIPKKEVRYYLGGLLVEIKGDQVRYVSTDVHRLLASNGAHCDNVIGCDQSVIIPRDSIEKILKLKGPYTQATITIDDQKNVLLSCNGLGLTCKPIDGIFPDWRRVIPKPVKEVKAAQYNADFLLDFQKIAILLQGKKDANAYITQVENDAALVRLCRSNHTIGVIMPIRSNTYKDELFMSAPSWVHESEAANA